MRGSVHLWEIFIELFEVRRPNPNSDLLRREYSLYSGPYLVVEVYIRDMEEGSVCSLPACIHSHWQIHFTDISACFLGIYTKGQLSHPVSRTVKLFGLWLLAIVINPIIYMDVYGFTRTNHRQQNVELWNSATGLRR